ncbi:MAG: sulfatase [Halioglobus sp.]|nr:sulfatase [Halioglobus sp.]
MKWKLVLLLLVPIAWYVSGFFDSDKVDRPNIILIIADDLGPQLGVYGDPNAHTPNIDQIAQEGTRFNAGYVTAASCSPSRGSIFTGLYPHQHGMMGLSHFGTQRMHDDVPKLPNELKALGYRTAIIGKTHYEPSNLFEWDTEEVDDQKVIFDRDVLWMNQRAMDFVDEDSDPFFLVMSYVDPHRGDSDDGSRYGPRRNFKFPRTKLGLPQKATPPSEIEPFPFLGLDSPGIRKELADYYGAVDRLDIGVGDLRNQLVARGLWKDALVIFIGDHGPDVTRGKMAVYESAVRIPFLLKAPGAEKGVVREELVSTVDLFPTLLDAAKSGQANSHEGRSLLPLTMAGASPDWRRYMFTEYITHVPDQFYPRYAVRDNRYKLIFNVQGGEVENPLTPINYCNAWWESRKPRYRKSPIKAVYDRVENPPKIELYDLQEDPYEWHNLADDPGLAEVKERLVLAIQEWRQSTRDPLLDPAEFEKERKKMDGKY